MKDKKLQPSDNENETIDGDEETDDESQDDTIIMLDDMITIPLDYVKNRLKVIKIKNNSNYLIFLETYIEIKNLFVLMASYYYLDEYSLNHSILLNDCLKKIDNYMEKILKLETDEKHLINIFKFSRDKLHNYKKLCELKKSFLNKPTELTENDKNKLKKLYDKIFKEPDIDKI